MSRTCEPWTESSDPAELGELAVFLACSTQPIRSWDVMGFGRGRVVPECFRHSTTTLTRLTIAAAGDRTSYRNQAVLLVNRFCDCGSKIEQSKEEDPNGNPLSATKKLDQKGANRWFGPQRARSTSHSYRSQTGRS